MPCAFLVVVGAPAQPPPVSIWENFSYYYLHAWKLHCRPIDCCYPHLTWKNRRASRGRNKYSTKKQSPPDYIYFLRAAEGYTYLKKKKIKKNVDFSHYISSWFLLCLLIRVAIDWMNGNRLLWHVRKKTPSIVFFCVCVSLSLCFYLVFWVLNIWILDDIRIVAILRALRYSFVSGFARGSFA